jgi:hypothetical protein
VHVLELTQMLGPQRYRGSIVRSAVSPALDVDLMGAIQAAMAD